MTKSNPSSSEPKPWRQIQGDNGVMYPVCPKCGAVNIVEFCGNCVPLPTYPVGALTAPSSPDPVAPIAEETKPPVSETDDALCVRCGHRSSVHDDRGCGECDCWGLSVGRPRRIAETKVERCCCGGRYTTGFHSPKHCCTETGGRPCYVDGRLVVHPSPKTKPIAGPDAPKKCAPAHHVLGVVENGLEYCECRALATPVRQHLEGSGDLMSAETKPVPEEPEAAFIFGAAMKDDSRWLDGALWLYGSEVTLIESALATITRLRADLANAYERIELQAGALVGVRERDDALEAENERLRSDMEEIGRIAEEVRGCSSCRSVGEDWQGPGLCEAHAAKTASHFAAIVKGEGRG